MLRTACAIVAIVVVTGCSAGVPTASAPLAAPTSRATDTPAVTASAEAAPSEAMATLPEPVCAKPLIPPVIVAEPHANDGLPDPEGRIAFGMITADDVTLLQRVSLYAIDPDGSDLARLLDCEVARPRFSPDGQRLAFGIVVNDRTFRVATMDADGTDLRILAPGPWAEMPDWSPDGRWLVYISSPVACDRWPACNTEDGFRETLWRMDADGTHARQIGAPDMFDWEPRLSPDGNEVVFSRTHAPDYERMTTMVRDLRTGAERQATSDANQPEHPDWSPDGRWIIYNTLGPLDGASFEQIERVPADDPTAPPEILYAGDGKRAGIKPAYSPDGSAIVFGCSGKLCRMDADGRNVETILEVPGRELNHFDWGPASDPSD